MSSPTVTALACVSWRALVGERLRRKGRSERLAECHSGSLWVTLGHSGSLWVTLGHSGRSAGSAPSQLSAAEAHEPVQ
eukprot:6336263-Pyramimonas_sp.AAC.1